MPYNDEAGPEGTATTMILMDHRSSLMDGLPPIGYI